ncbi:MAG TPA: response regulator transcription factor [Candidatus Dormibacteraeota bacterium]|nr:response regulator transcription factor [Candidatus Dormibacteraeota bacterium]
MTKPSKKTVYIVDDHPVFRHGLRHMIAAEPGFEVVGEAGDDATALAEIRAVKPTVAIVDVRLPKRGGIELVRALRSMRPAPACVMLTMNAEQSAFNAALDAGAQGYILKDDALDLVRLGLKAITAGTFYFSPVVSEWMLNRHHKSLLFKEKRTGLSALTPTERQILQLVAENKTNREIARELFISPRTVETHRANTCQKLHLQGAHKLLQFAIEHRSEL